MKFRAILRRIGNSRGVIIPSEVITGMKLGDEIEVEVITKGEESVKNGQKVITKMPASVFTKPEVITPFLETKNLVMKWCKQHNAWKSTCKCK